MPSTLTITTIAQLDLRAVKMPSRVCWRRAFGDDRLRRIRITPMPSLRVISRSRCYSRCAFWLRHITHDARGDGGTLSGLLASIYAIAVRRRRCCAIMRCARQVKKRRKMPVHTGGSKTHGVKTWHLSLRYPQKRCAR